MGARPTNFRLLIANLGLLATGETISKAFTLIAFAYLARVLGPSSYGIIEFALAVIFVFSLVVDLGLGVYGAREIAKDARLVALITRRVVITRSWLTLLSLGMLVLFVLLVAKPWEVKQVLLLFGLSLVPAPLLLQWVFQGSDLMRWVSIGNIVRYGTFGLVVLATVRGAAQLWMIPIAELTAVTACVGFSLVVYRRRFGPIRLLPLAWPDLRLLAESIPIGLSQFMWAIKFFFAIMLLGILAREEDVGRFGAALRIIIALHTFIALYVYNLLPSISRCGREPASVLRSIVGESVRASSWIALLICVIGTICAAPAIRLVYGANYEESTIVLQLLLWMLGIIFLGAHYRCTLIGCGRQGLELISTSVGAGFNVLLIVLLYSQFGLVGAASAMLISELITGALAYYFVNHRIARIGAGQYLRQSTVVALALALAMYLTATVPLWLKACVALTVFVGGICLLDPKLFTDLRALLTASPPSESKLSGS